MKIRFIGVMVCVLFFTFYSGKIMAETPPQDPEEVLTRLYDLVSFEKGNSPDWDEVRQLFFNKAVVILRTSRTEHKMFDLEGFVADFKSFIKTANVKETGFSETILKTNGKVFGDIAWFSVLYKAEVTGTERKNLGVDHFSLVKMQDDWKIISITNEIPSEKCPIPEELRD